MSNLFAFTADPSAVLPVGSVKEVVLQRLRVGAQYVVGSFMLDSLTLEQVAVGVGRDLAVMLTAHVLADELPPETVTKTATVTEARTVEWVVPATWWDHFKLQHAQRWWARWFVARYPAAVVNKAETVRLVRDVKLTVDLRRYRTYPEANVVLPPNTYGHVYRAYHLDTRWEGVDR